MLDVGAGTIAVGGADRHALTTLPQCGSTSWFEVGVRKFPYCQSILLTKPGLDRQCRDQGSEGHSAARKRYATHYCPVTGADRHCKGADSNFRTHEYKSI